MSYGIISNARFLIQVQSGKSSKTAIQTKHNDTLIGRILSVLGPAISASLAEIEDEAATFPTADILSFFNIPEAAPNSKTDEIRQKIDIFTFSGFVSKTGEVNGGRTAPDRQFVYVNSRPVDAPFLTKIVNSEWRKYSSKKYPVLVLNINVNQSAVDVNLAPDKRTIVLENKKHCQFRFK